jgi:hypothetical protein
MNGYRLYYMDRFSGHIDHRRDFVAAGDTAAIEVANGWTTGQPMELWQAGRKVKRWEAAAMMPPAPVGDPFISTGA